DCNTNPLNPIIGVLGRSFSSDPDLVALHAEAWIEEHRKSGIISCCKHFPGHGSSRADSHLGLVDISRSWDPEELRPYRLLLEKDAIDMIMTGHLFNNRFDPNFPATLSGKIIAGLLRAELGYRGVVISDDMQMRAISDHFGFKEAICKSLAAGVDMLVFGNNLDYDPDVCRRAVTAVLRGLEENKLTEERVRSALARVAGLKEQLGKNHE
ncbi:MAG: glycoside hydrolase family 3 N-terminal domain-containing protein, partial [Desulfofustis sp.]